MYELLFYLMPHRIYYCRLMDKVPYSDRNKYYFEVIVEISVLGVGVP